MKQSLRISKLPTLAQLRNRSTYNEIIREICFEIETQRIVPMDRVWVDFLWIEKNRLGTPSKISALGREVIIEALVRSNVIHSEEWISIIGFSDHFSTSSKDPHIKVVLDDLETITPNKTNHVLGKSTY